MEISEIHVTLQELLLIHYIDFDDPLKEKFSLCHCLLGLMLMESQVKFSRQWNISGASQ